MANCLFCLFDFSLFLFSYGSREPIYLLVDRIAKLKNTLLPWFYITQIRQQQSKFLLASAFLFFMPTYCQKYRQETREKTELRQNKPSPVPHFIQKHRIL